MHDRFKGLNVVCPLDCRQFTDIRVDVVQPRDNGFDIEREALIELGSNATDIAALLTHL
jgi:hypothetical protein